MTPLDISDPDILAVARGGFGIINAYERLDVEGAKAKLVLEYCRRRALHYEHRAALYELAEILQRRYPGSPRAYLPATPIAAPPDPRPSSEAVFP